MKYRCNGCGAKIQTDNPKSPGYIRKDVLENNPNDFLCERCFNIQHYNKNIKVSIGEEDFLKIAKNISNEKNLIVNVIDVFDLDGTVLKNINNLFPKSKILLVANKYDLFLKSNKPMKIKKYVQDYLAKNQIKTEGIIISSAKEEIYARKVMKAIEEIVTDEKVYFFGTTNVGKSTLINSIMNLFFVEDDNFKHPLVTVSNNPGTTLDIIEIELPNGIVIKQDVKVGKLVNDISDITVNVIKHRDLPTISTTTTTTSTTTSKTTSDETTTTETTTTETTTTTVAADNNSEESNE